MTRVFAEPVEVRRRDEDPDQFLWRGRRYVVREVLGRWTEAGQWWRTAAVTALATGDTALEAAPPALAVDDDEREWWRVEAGSGAASASSAGTGVYDLCFAWSTGTWSLARVQD